MTAPRLALMMLIVGLSAACSTPAHRPLDPVQRDRIQRLGVLSPALPEAYDVRMVVHPGESLGLVGLLLAEGHHWLRSDDFNQAVKSLNGPGCSNSFRQHLEAGLQASGYELVRMRVPRSLRQPGFLDRYPPADGSVDAYLDLYSELVGYTAAGANTPYRPTVHLNVRLVRARDHRVLYQDRIAYNAFGDGDGAITLSPAQGYAFASIGQLLQQPGDALEGLQLAMQTTGEVLGRQLR